MPLRPGNPGDVQIAQFEIEVENTYHLKNLYKLMHEWIIEEGFTDDDLPGEKTGENLYWERVSPNGAKEHHIWWRFSRIPENNPYFKYFLKVDYQTLGMKSTEVIHQGQKFSTNKGDVIIRVQAWIQLDYADKFSKGLMGLFHNVFRKRVYHQQLESRKSQFYNDVYRFQSTIKTYLELKNPYSPQKLFRPVKGVNRETYPKPTN